MSSGEGARRRALLIVNTGSRRGEAGVHAGAGRLRELGFELREERVAPRCISDRIRRRAAEVDCVIVAGGDGTVNAAVAGLVDTQLPMGLWPLGTANDLGRTLGLPTALETAAEVVAAGVTRRIDVGRVNDRYFVNVASFGLSTEITRRLSRRAKRWWGWASYGVVGAAALARARPMRVRIEHAGGVVEAAALQVSVGNGRHFGGGMTVAPHARIDEGLLDLFTLEPKSRLGVLRLLPAMRRGRHVELEGVRLLRSDRFRVWTDRPHDIDTDGELTTRTPAEFRVLAAALTVFVPGEERGLEDDHVAA